MKSKSTNIRLPENARSMVETCAIYALLTVGTMSFLMFPEDDSPAWFTEMTVSKTISALCFAALAWLMRKENKTINR